LPKGNLRGRVCAGTRGGVVTASRVLDEHKPIKGRAMRGHVLYDEGARATRRFAVSYSVSERRSPVHDKERTPDIRSRTMRDLLDQYLRDNLLRPASIRAYRNVTLQLIKDRAAPRDDLGLAEVTHDLLIAWRAQILERARPTTWNYYRRHLRALLNHALTKDWLAESPLRQVKSAPVGAPERRAVPQESLTRLLAELNDDYGQPYSMGNTLYPRWFWRIVVLTLYYTGMRRRQLVSLRWRDIDFDKAEILLRYEGSKTRRQWEIPISEGLMPELLKLRERTCKHRGLVDSTKLVDDQVFNVTLFYKRYRGTRMTSDQLTGFFRRLGEISTVPVSAHRMRHTVATELTRGDRPDVQAVAALLGHTDIRTTLRYVHTDTAQMRRLLTGLPAL
jgi:integrase